MSIAPHDLEMRAERAVRRGELLQALELYEAILADRPEDERVRSRMDSVRALLQPSELVSRRRTEPEEIHDEPGLDSLSDAEQGEMHASSGRFEDAVACYRRALEKSPKNELLRERYDELVKLSPPASLARHDGLEQAPRLDPLMTPPPGVPKLKPPAAPPLRAPAPPVKPAPPAAKPPEAKPARSAALPADPIERLQALLARVRTGRRRPAAGA